MRVGQGSSRLPAQPARAAARPGGAAPPAGRGRRRSASSASRSRGVPSATMRPSLQHHDAVGQQHRLGHVVGDHHAWSGPAVVQGAVVGARASRVSGSSAPNGSSISISAGSAASARATPTRWRWPPESAAGTGRGAACGRGARGRAARRPARRCGPCPSRAACGVMAMFSRHGQVREEADLLEDVADAAAQRDRVDRRDVLAVDPDGPGGRRRSGG